MNETRRMTLEREAGGERRSLCLERTVEERLRDAPTWDRMMNGSKEGLGAKGEIFIRSFMAGLVPCAVFAAIMLLLFIAYLMGGD